MNDLSNMKKCPACGSEYRNMVLGPCIEGPRLVCANATHQWHYVRPVLGPGTYAPINYHSSNPNVIA